MKKSKIKMLLLNAVETSKRRGFRYVIRAGLDYVLIPALWSIYYRIFRGTNKFSTDTFELQGRTYHYYNHPYERAVEIPIAREFFQSCEGKDILEVGNVLNWYFDFKHDVLDKYEPAEGVINEDVVSFKPSKRYDLIISVSTIEHVGWDENPRDSMKTLHAIENLRSILAAGGKMLVTVPIGYNSFLDDLLFTGKLKFERQYYLKRISRSNKWRQIGWDEIKNVKYGSPYRFANGIVVGIIEMPENSS